MQDLARSTNGHVHGSRGMKTEASPVELNEQSSARSAGRRRINRSGGLWFELNCRDPVFSGVRPRRGIVSSFRSSSNYLGFSQLVQV